MPKMTSRTSDDILVSASKLRLHSRKLKRASLADLDIQRAKVFASFLISVFFRRVFGPVSHLLVENQIQTIYRLSW